MHDELSQYDAPPTPEDLALLVSMAGPIFAESRLIESYTSNSPQYDGRIDEGSMKIKRGLEQMERQVRASAPTPPQYQQQYQPPPYAQQPLQYLPPPMPYIPPTPPSSDGQLEFNFNLTEQKKTNDLLLEISRKISKLISCVENTIPKNGPTNTIPKHKGV